MAQITSDDVAVVIGRPISDSDEQAQVTQWIDDVEMLLTARLGDLSVLDDALLAYVEREAVVARMKYRDDRNSDAPKDSNGEDSYFLRFLDPWWIFLAPEDVSRANQAYSVSLAGPDVF